MTKVEVFPGKDVFHT